MYVRVDTGHEVLTVANVNITASCDMTPCCLVDMCQNSEKPVLILKVENVIKAIYFIHFLKLLSRYCSF